MLPWEHLSLKHKLVWCAYLGKPCCPAGPAVWVQLSIDTAVKLALSGRGRSCWEGALTHSIDASFVSSLLFESSEARPWTLGSHIPGTTHTIMSLLLQALWRGKSPLALRRYNPKPHWPLYKEQLSGGSSSRCCVPSELGGLVWLEPMESVEKIC